MIYLLKKVSIYSILYNINSFLDENRGIAIPNKEKAKTLNRFTEVGDSSPILIKTNRFDGKNHKSSYYILFYKGKYLHIYIDSKAQKQVINRFDSMKKIDYISTSSQSKNQFFNELSSNSRNINEIFQNRSLLQITENIENLIETLKKHLKFNKISINQLFDEEMLNFNEFCIGFYRIGLNLCKGDYLDIFRYFDKENKGFISIEDFYNVLFSNNTNTNLLEGKSMIIDENIEKSEDRLIREQVFGLITSMKKYTKLKKTPIITFFNNFELQRKETIDFNEFLALLERMEFSLTKGESKKVFDYLSQNEVNKARVKWGLFYDCLTETVDIAGIKKEIMRNVQENKVNLKDFYKRYDLNQDMRLSFEEFKLFLKELIPELNFIDIYEIFIDIDKTKDDKISYEEFEYFLLSATNFYTISDEALKSDIKFLMNYLRKGLKLKGLSPRLFFEEYLDLEQSEMSVIEFKRVIKQMNSGLKDEEIDLIRDYFQLYQENEDYNYIDYTLFYLFVDCPVDFFIIFYMYHEYLRFTRNNFDYLFLLADLDEDLKLSIQEYNNFLKEINIKEINLHVYIENFYYLADKKENYIGKERLRLLLENFVESQNVLQRKIDKNYIFEENLEKLTFQLVKNDKLGAKKYIFFKFSEVLPFLMEMSVFLRKSFKDIKDFKGKILEIFDDLTQNKTITMVSKIQFKIRLLKLDSFFTPMKINKMIEILNYKERNECDLEEFIFLMENFEEIFYSKLNKEEKIVNSLL